MKNSTGSVGKPNWPEMETRDEIKPRNSFN